MPSERIQRQIDRLLDEAEEALSRFDWETVGKCAGAVLRLDSSNADAITFLEAAQGDAATAAEQHTTQDTGSSSIAPPQAQPTSFADGRYQVQRFLGEGGKKKVYLAHDELLDRDVAFALIKTEGLDEVSRTRISREAQAMGRLGSHPSLTMKTNHN